MFNKFQGSIYTESKGHIQGCNRKQLKENQLIMLLIRGGKLQVFHAKYLAALMHEDVTLLLLFTPVSNLSKALVMYCYDPLKIHVTKYFNCLTLALYYAHGQLSFIIWK